MQPCRKQFDSAPAFCSGLSLIQTCLALVVFAAPAISGELRPYQIPDVPSAYGSERHNARIDEEYYARFHQTITKLTSEQKEMLMNEFKKRRRIASKKKGQAEAYHYSRLMDILRKESK